MKNTRTINTVPAPKFLVAALLFAACSLLFLPGCQSPLQQQETPASGTGTFLLTIGGVERTIVPVLSVARFERFRIDFEPADGCDEGNASDYVDDWQPGHHIELQVGTWDFRVTAFTGTNDTEPAAEGFLSGIVMAPAGYASGNIVLSPIIDGEGIFSWRGIDFSDFDAAEMEIFEWYDNAIGDSLHDFDLLYAGTPDQVVLYAGQYYVVFTLTNEDGATAKMGHVLHVYRYIDTELAADLFEDVAFPGTWFRPVPGTMLYQQLGWLRTNAASGNVYLIELHGIDDEIVAADGNLIFADRSDITVILTGGDTMRTVSHFSGAGPLFTVFPGVTLVLDYNVTLQGIDNNTQPLVLVSGTLVMNEGSLITGNTSLGDGGGVVLMVFQGSIGTLHLEGGKIYDNTARIGGGVFNQGGVINMREGVIAGNTATMQGGGVAVSASGTFNMYDGGISGNDAASGGGVLTMHGGVFNMHGGGIFGNEVTANGGGVRVMGGLFEGVTPTTSTLNMRGGSIFNNIAVGGGGIETNVGGTVHMHDGTIVSNEASVGGGVLNMGAGWFSMRGGAISDNTAAALGGGFSNNSGGNFHMSGGFIHGINTDPANLGNMSPLGSMALHQIGANAGVGTVVYTETGMSFTGVWGLASTNLTLDVVDGTGMTVAISGLPPGYARRISARFDDVLHQLSPWFVIPATGATTILFTTTPGTWTLVLEVAPVDGAAVLIDQMVSYTTTTNLARGANTLTLDDDFTPLAVGTSANLGRSVMAAPQSPALAAEELVLPVEGFLVESFAQPNDAFAPLSDRSLDLRQLKQIPLELQYMPVELQR